MATSIAGVRLARFRPGHVELLAATMAANPYAMEDDFARDPEANLRAIAVAPDSVMFSVEHGGCWLGGAYLSGIREHSCWISAYLRPGGGVFRAGAALAETGRYAARRLGVSRVQASVCADNAVTLAVCGRCGFQVYGRFKQAWRHRGRVHDGVLLAKTGGWHG